MGTGKSAIEALSANVLAARFADLDAATVESAKNRLIDVIGCAIGGARDPGCRELVRLAGGWGGSRETTVIAHALRAPAQTAAMVNAVMARAFDFEAMSGELAGRRYIQHASGTTVPTALALGEKTGVSGRELVTALVAGDDVVNRIALSYDFDFFGGFDGTMTHPHFGATAIAGRLLGLNERQMQNAFGIVLNLIGGSFQTIWDGAATFKLGQGAAARNGIFAAELAGAGWTGPEDALSGTYGFYRLFTPGCTHPEMLTLDLGKTFYTENQFKRYPCGAPNHVPIDLALSLVRRYGIRAEDIAEVVLAVNRHSLDNYYAKPWKIRSFPHGDAVFSFRYCVCTALLRNHVTVADFTDDAIRDPQVGALIERMAVVELAPDAVAPVELTVRMKDGRYHTAYPAANEGSFPDRPMTRDELIGKFMDQVAFSATVSHGDAEEIVVLVERIEEVADVSRIARLAAVPASPD